MRLTNKISISCWRLRRSTKARQFDCWFFIVDRMISLKRGGSTGRPCSTISMSHHRNNHRVRKRTASAPMQANIIHLIVCCVFIWSTIVWDSNILQLVESLLETFPGRRQRVSSLSSIGRKGTVLMEQENIDPGVTTIPGPWNATTFGATNCWGRRPLLIRNAFNDTTMLPKWDDILDLASEAYAEENDAIVTSRIIQHIPGTLDTYRAEFGPFSSQRTYSLFGCRESNMDGDSASGDYVSSLIVNDVDRWLPEVSHWMDHNFGGALPRWRRDDAQVSIAPRRAGIGPHVDNYDVFLIQIQGSRAWQVGPVNVSHYDEVEHLLVESSEVSILNLTKTASTGDEQSVTLHVKEGDCLYLPPRAVHCGVSTSDDCVTLSVGCRSPSASELLARVAEHVATSTLESAVSRYKDVDLWSTSSLTGVLDEGIKSAMKDLLLQAVNDVVNSDAVWDEMVGQIVTDSKRPVGDYPVPIREMSDDWKNDLGIWADPVATVDSILSGTGALYRSEGVSFATSTVGNSHRLFAQGRTYEICSGGKGNSVAAPALLSRIANGPPLDLEALSNMNLMPLSNEVVSFLRELLAEGILYGWSDEP